MKHVEYTPVGVCSRKISFDLTDDGKISNLTYIGGCNGNLKAIGKLVEGKDSQTVSLLLKGNSCGNRPTSCADQLSKAIEQAMK